MGAGSVADDLDNSSIESLISYGGTMGRLIRAFDWGQTSLGPINKWPASILTATNVCVNSRFEICLWLGPELIFVYNDAYISSLAMKHPSALGRPGREVWWEIWNTVGPMLQKVLETGEPTFAEDLHLEMQRRGFKEETYYTFSYSPILERGEIKGIFTALKETTERVVGERRLRTLRELGQRGVEASTPMQAVEIAAETLSQNGKDLPFVLIYLVAKDRPFADLLAKVGLQSDHPSCPTQVDLRSGTDPWKFRQAISSKEALNIDKLPAGLELEAADKALVVPIARAGSDDPYGIFVAGLSSHLLFDDSYRTFVGLVAAQIATAIANASALEEQRERAEALAKIDRAKTVFFSNVSHEFRTPLTLILGPVERMLQEAPTSVTVSRAELQLVHRNSMRLLKLVNTLLDFSRIEAGRVEAIYEPTDISIFTSDTASAFRSAMEQAGLEFVVDCESLSEPVYVDRDMWEKIVLNLISNAFKFTLSGRVTVRLKALEDQIELRVEDTGLGIPNEEQSRVFERFHRVEGLRGRSHEGTGIGLALVQELVKLHQGSIRVESAVGEGSKFIVSIPKRGVQPPSEGLESKQRMLKSTGVAASAYVNEALRWLPDTEKTQTQEVFASDSVQAPHVQTTTGRILLADDNADMRQYVRRLLGDNYEVDAVSNGIEALSSIRNNIPDLVLTDVMMPGLDGFGLLRELRANESTKTVPVILLSARAGEDARIEGMQAGADDYMVKPFTARELLARVGAHLAMGCLRREVAEHERSLRADLEVRVRERTADLERLNQELRQLSSRLQQMRDEERRNLARALHDSAGQLLAAIAMNLAVVRSESHKLSPEAAKRVEENAEIVQRLTNEIRTISHLLHPPLLDEVGLSSALRWYVEGFAERSRIAANLEMPEILERFPADIEIAIFRAVQECLTNVHRHSGCRSCTVKVSRKENNLRVEVSDDGKGMPDERRRSLASSGGGVGLRGMKERISQLGGALIIDSSENGTRVEVSLPIPSTVVSDAGVASVL